MVRNLKFLSFLFLFLTTPLYTGCVSQTSEKVENYALYFLKSDLKEVAGAGVLQTELSDISKIENSNPTQTAQALLTELLRGPESEKLQNTIPSGTTLLALSLDEGSAHVDLSSSYGGLSGVNLTLADYAVTLTLTQIPEISSVEITVQGQELAYREKQSFTPREVFLFSEDDVVGTVTAEIFFLNTERILTAEERTLSLYEGDTQVEAVARAVENAPLTHTLLPVCPEGFRVSAVWQEEDICFLNLSSASLDALPEDTALYLTLEALDRSLCSLENIQGVRYLVDGELLESYGRFNLTEPYTND